MLHVNCLLIGEKPDPSKIFQVPASHLVNNQHAHIPSAGHVPPCGGTQTAPLLPVPVIESNITNVSKFICVLYIMYEWTYMSV